MRPSEVYLRCFLNLPGCPAPFALQIVICPNLLTKSAGRQIRQATLRVRGAGHRIAFHRFPLNFLFLTSLFFPIDPFNYCFFILFLSNNSPPHPIGLKIYYNVFPVIIRACLLINLREAQTQEKKSIHVLSRLLRTYEKLRNLATTQLPSVEALGPLRGFTSKQI